MAAPNTQSTVLDAFGVELLSAIHKIREPVSFSAGERIFEQNAIADAFYIIDSGEVAIEVPTPDVDTDPVLEVLVAGDFLGEEALLGGSPHWASATAITDVELVRVSASDLRTLYKEQPEEGVAVLRAMARYTANRLRDASARVAESLADDAPDPVVDEMVATAVAAQAEFEFWPEDRVDALLEDIATSINARGPELAADTVAETTLGNADHKTAKIQFGSMAVLETLRGEVASGTVNIDEQKKIREIASPVGVIFALVPVTNPVPTIANKTLIALKGRNSIILSTHRMAKGVAEKTGDIIAEALERHGAPAGLVQGVLGKTSRRRTAKFMRHDDVSLILATGGPGMVKAAYSSGTPAIGVGAGNAPAWVSADADPATAAQAIVISKSFDNGLICGSEQHIVVDASLKDASSRRSRQPARRCSRARRPRRWSSARSTTTGTCCSSTSAARRRCSRRWPGSSRRRARASSSSPSPTTCPRRRSARSAWRRCARCSPSTATTRRSRSASGCSATRAPATPPSSTPPTPTARRASRPPSPPAGSSSTSRRRSASAAW